MSTLSTTVRAVGVVLVLVLAGVLAGCGDDNAAASKTVVVATHDSFVVPKPLVKAFEKKTGLTVKVLQQGDAGALTNKLVLTKDAPLADAVYGIDNTFASRAYDERVLAPYTSKALPASAHQFALPAGSGGKALTPVDYGDVCVNVDEAWFAQHDVPEPKTLDDLTKPAYRGLFVTPGATTSSPGLAFLLATIAAKGDGWKDYWSALMKNDAKVDAGWEDAYETDFTAGGGKGDRPIVLSYSSSPPFTIPKGAHRPTTSALLDTCFRQVEYAGVLAGARNPQGAREFVDFMLSKGVQASLPDNMYVYPVDKAVKLPSEWAEFATVSPKPFTISPADITKNRTTWLRDWRDVVSR